MVHMGKKLLTVSNLHLRIKIFHAVWLQVHEVASVVHWLYPDFVVDMKPKMDQILIKKGAQLKKLIWEGNL